MKPIEEVIDSWSASRISMAAKCLYQFYRVYILGDRKPPGAALVFGSSMDEMANQSYTRAMATEEIPSSRECQEIFRSEWDVRQHEVENWRGEDPNDLDRIGTTGVALWHDEFAAPIHPVAVQKPFLLEFEGFPWRVDGAPDLDFRLPGDTESVIRCADLKTMKQRWSDGRLLTEPLFPLYTMATRAKYGVDPTGGIEIHGILKTKKGGTMRKSRVVSASEQQGMITKISRYRELIKECYKTGCFPPTGKDCNHFMCSRKYCGFADECEKEFGGVIPQ